MNDPNVTLRHGDALDVLRTLPDASIARATLVRKYDRVNPR